ncbi:MAG TPA: type II toxin-antitoxin system RelE/ParE family toxin [Chloroflexota bacterium]|nr:type II toxin-antitoxin system RelE/ParE family toxin [Chloroflexota bacterium]
MRVRVELIDEAVTDLVRYSESGNLALFLKKLLRLEELGIEAGQPLGGALTNWRKIVVGDRDWRIIYTVDPEDTVATVWVIGDRADAECYQEAQTRVARLAETRPEARTLASVMFQISQSRRSRRRGKRSR